ncbi:LANO_0D03554g1_1 [Lachancea nothofagi CBS 11611]|uniref:LANO_0D03554g1_1 n=1 Tax=Lachancea nothofagi CBS 11611 TaxID=1266666 RepID=A0A1G4JFC6_9SACH|nr:LANO_0D03554g1_1 [Lachancea nothofagi CBS 11611]
MGNNSSTANLPQNKKISQLTQESRGRQDSITSQLFPSRSAGRHPESKKISGWKGRVLPGSSKLTNTMSTPSAQSPFRNNYSLDAKSESPAPFALKKSALGNPAPPMCIAAHASAEESSSSSLRDHLAELSLQNSEGQPTTVTAISSASGTAPVLRSPGPSTPVVKSTKEDALSDHLSSILSLKKLLVEGRIGDQINPPSSSINIPRRSSTALSDSYLSDDEDDEEALLQGTSDVVINNSLLENAMKRKRDTKKANVIGTSWSSHETLQHPGLKKLKPLSSDSERVKLPDFKVMHARRPEEEEDSTAIPRLVQDNFDRIDSFEKGTVEHYEGTNESGNSSQNLTSSSHQVTSSQSEAIETHVIVKWKDNIVDPKTCKMSIVSKDISSVLGLQHRSKKIPMEYDTQSKCWTAANLFLPPGVYKFQFLINGELRHSEFLPTATDSFGNCVNWFEVVSGHDIIEPSRDLISKVDARYDNHDFTMHDSTSPRPPMNSDGSSSSNFKGSVKNVERTGTPYSDYTGLCSRSGSFKPSLNHRHTSSLDLLAPLKPKKYEYSSEIPELFKANFDEDLDLPAYEEDLRDPGSGKIRPSFLHRVQDCNQDILFADLQEDGKLDSQAAEKAFLEQYPTPDLPVYLDSSFLNAVFSRFQKKNESTSRVNHIVPHVNLNHLLTSSIRDEIISVGCTTRYEGKFLTQIIYTPCYYGNKESAE